MKSSPESEKKSRHRSGRASSPAPTGLRRENEGRKKTQGSKSKKDDLKRPLVVPLSGTGSQEKKASNVREGRSRANEHDKDDNITSSRHGSHPPPPKLEDKSPPYPYVSTPRDVILDSFQKVEPSATAPIAAVEIFSQKLRRSSATNDYLRKDSMIYDDPDESSPKPMMRRNSYSFGSDILKKSAPLNDNSRKNSSTNLRRHSSRNELSRTNDINLRRNSSSTQRLRQNSSSNECLSRKSSSNQLSRRDSSSNQLLRRNSNSDLLGIASSAFKSGQNAGWDGSGKQRELLTSLQLQETYTAAAAAAAVKILGGKHNKASEVNDLHNLVRDRTSPPAAMIPPTLNGGEYPNSMPSKERKRIVSPSREAADPVEAATKLIEKYSKETMDEKKEGQSPHQGRKSSLISKRNPLDTVSDADGKISSFIPNDERRNSIIRNYAKQKRRLSSSTDPRLHERRYQRLSAHASKIDPRSSQLKQQQTLIDKHRNKPQGKDEKKTQLQSSSSQSCTSNSHGDDDSQCASLAQKSVDDLVVKKKDGGFVEIDLGDADDIDSNIPLSIEFKDSAQKQENFEASKVQKKSKKGKTKRRSNETKSTVDPLYDSVDLDDPFIGVEIPLPIGKRRKTQKKRPPLKAASIKEILPQKKTKIIVLSLLGLGALIAISLLVYFLVPRKGQKSSSTDSQSGSYQNFGSSSNESALNSGNNSFSSAPQANNEADSLHFKPSGENAEKENQLQTSLPSELILEKDFISDPNYPVLQKVSGSSMALPDSPQFKASYWLLQHDSLQIAWNDVRFLPRYGLATVYYALNGEEWIKAERWLGDSDFCTWHGVCCLDASLAGCEKVFNGQSIALDLENNNLSGTIPDEISLIEVAILQLGRNLITGTLPSSIGNMPKLKNLNLGSNQIKGSLPSNLWQAANLVEISMHDNLLTGFFPEYIGKLYKLESLDFGANQLSGSIPNVFGQTTELKKIDFGTNKLWGKIPETIFFLQKLAELSVFENLLTGTLNDAIQNIRTLQILKLHTNKFTGTLPTSIGGCVAMESLQLHSNAFSGTIPPALGELLSLKYLYLDDNHFTGSLPLELSKLSALRYFDANGNSLTGEIPLAYGKLVSLRGLNLGRNRLRGSLPVSFNEQLSQLEYLILNQNEMMGTLTPSIWQVASLAVLDLHQNRFSGSLPKIFGVNSLQVLDLENNTLQGTIPNDLLLAPQLKFAYFRWNNFFGMIDEHICSSKNLEQLFVDCISQLECSCCEKCA